MPFKTQVVFGVLCTYISDIAKGKQNIEIILVVHKDCEHSGGVWFSSFAIGWTDCFWMSHVASPKGDGLLPIKMGRLYNHYYKIFWVNTGTHTAQIFRTKKEN